MPNISSIVNILKHVPALLGIFKQLRGEPQAAALSDVVASTRHAMEDFKRTAQQRLDDLEKEVNKMKVPAFLADQFYGLRGHIALAMAIETCRRHFNQNRSQRRKAGDSLEFESLRRTLEVNSIGGKGRRYLGVQTGHLVTMALCHSRFLLTALFSRCSRLRHAKIRTSDPLFSVS